MQERVVLVGGVIVRGERGEGLLLRSHGEFPPGGRGGAATIVGVVVGGGRRGRDAHALLGVGGGGLLLLVGHVVFYDGSGDV